MKKFLVIMNIAFFIGCLSKIGASQSIDESDLKKYEVGGHFTMLRRADAHTVSETFRRNDPTLTEFSPAVLSELGAGGRFTYNFTNNIAIEAEANFFPEDKKSNFVIGVPVRVVEPGGRKFQMVFGPKVGYRKRTFGVFGKLRPGFIRLDRFDVVTQVIGSPVITLVISETKRGVNFFNIDVGGVFEYYPSRRTVFRVDVGDTIIRYNAQEPKDINPSFTRHNLQINVGVGFRF